MTQVRTRAELESAVRKGVREMTIEGSLAQKVRTGRRLRTLGAATLAVLVVALTTAPLTGGLSVFGAAALAWTGTDVALILVCLAVGVGLLLAIWEGYEEISFDPGPPPVLVLRKKLRTWEGQHQKSAQGP